MIICISSVQMGLPTPTRGHTLTSDSTLHAQKDFFRNLLFLAKNLALVLDQSSPQFGRSGIFFLTKTTGFCDWNSLNCVFLQKNRTNLHDSRYQTPYSCICTDSVQMLLKDSKILFMLLYTEGRGIAATFHEPRQTVYKTARSDT